MGWRFVWLPRVALSVAVPFSMAPTGHPVGAVWSEDTP